MERHRAWVAWSSGKDSAWAFHVARQSRQFEITALMTTVNSAFSRVAMHAVREALVEAQARAVGLPLVKVPIPYPCSNAEYERAMASAMQQAQAEGVSHVIFGDLFLEDVRRYREEKLRPLGMTPVFPIWGVPTDELAGQMVHSGLRAYLTCIDPRRLDRRLAGRVFDAQLLADLPAGIDPCGENGEFHTFCYSGPMFEDPLEVKAGEIVERDGFVFADVLPAITWPLARLA
jgi:uncharacterized protein (TIGR00290 family)